MADRWSPDDRAIYGAEDDEEMDMILDHLDRAMADTKSDDAERPRGQSDRRGESNEPPQ
jgi:hypothetical protein